MVYKITKPKIKVSDVLSPLKLFNKVKINQTGSDMVKPKIRNNKKYDTIFVISIVNDINNLKDLTKSLNLLRKKTNIHAIFIGCGNISGEKSVINNYGFDYYSSKNKPIDYGEFIGLTLKYNYNYLIVSNATQRFDLDIIDKIKSKIDLGEGFGELKIIDNGFDFGWFCDRKRFGELKKTFKGESNNECFGNVNKIFYDINVIDYDTNKYKEWIINDVEYDNVKILFLITNYERREMLLDLLSEVKSLNKKPNVNVDYVIFDDRSSYVLDDVNFIINDSHRAKPKYWLTFDDMFKYCENKTEYDIFIFSPNDYLNYDFNGIVEYGIKLKEQEYIFNTRNHNRVTCWNKTKGIDLINDISLIFYTDCAFFTNYKTLKMFDFKILNTKARNPKLGSGVGRQMTNRANLMKIPIFQPNNGFVTHGYVGKEHKSVMHI